MPEDYDRVLQGYAVFYDVVTHSENGKRCQLITPGAFDAYLASGNDVGFWIYHDPCCAVGSLRDGSLELHSDRRGLAFRMTLPENRLGTIARQHAESGIHPCVHDINSFFYVE